MHRRHQLTLICLMLFCTIQAQNNNNNTPDSKWGITLAPGFVLNPDFNFTLQPGVEYRVNKQFSLLGDIALPMIPIERDSLQDRSFFRIRAEARFETDILLAPIYEFDIYFGVQFAYSHRSFRDVNGGYYLIKEDNDSVVRFDQARIKSPVFTGTLQMGGIYEFNKNLCLDLSVGAGFRIIRTRYSKTTNLRKEEYYSDRIRFFTDAYLFPWSLTRGQLNASIRLIYRFD